MLSSTSIGTVEIEEGSPFFEELDLWVDDVLALTEVGWRPRTTKFIMGVVGEFLIWSLLMHTGEDPEPLDAESWYDQDKDGRIGNGSTYEVKTGKWWESEEAFATAPEQVDKICSADHCFYVQKPSDVSTTVNVWLFPEDARDHFYYKTNPNNDERALFPFTRLIKYATVSSPDLVRRLTL